MYSVHRNKFGRFEKAAKVENDGAIPSVKAAPEMSSSEATLVLAENIARLAEALSLSATNKLSPLMKKVAAAPMYGMGFDVEKYPTYFRDLCIQLNSIHCSIEAITSTINAIDL